MVETNAPRRPTPPRRGAAPGSPTREARRPAPRVGAADDGVSANVRGAVNQAAARAAPLGLTAVFSLLGALDVLALPTGGAPVRLALVASALILGAGLTIALDRPRSRPYWQMTLAVTAVLLPMTALQAAASRVPFVAVSRGSAGPLIALTLATAATLLGLWLFAAYQADRRPADAALLFLPAALLIPAVLGAPGGLDESSALATLGEACLVAAVAVFVGSLTPETWRPIAGGLALGTQFALLWILGRGPVLGQDGGAIVPASAALLLVETVLLTVLAPLAALFSRRFFQTVEEEAGVVRPASVPPRGARRGDY